MFDSIDDIVIESICSKRTHLFNLVERADIITDLY